MQQNTIVLSELSQSHKNKYVFSHMWELRGKRHDTKGVMEDEYIQQRISYTCMLMP